MDLVKGEDILLNPRLPEDVKAGLFALAQRTLDGESLKDVWALSSSGSTASDLRFLKMVFIRKENFLTAAEAAVKKLDLSFKDIWLKTLPDFHVGGLAILARQRVSRCGVENHVWSRATLRSLMEAQAWTHISLVPTQVYDLVQQKIRAPRSMRALIVGGSPLGEALEREVKGLGWPLLKSYGMTETSSMISLGPKSCLDLLPDVDVELGFGGELRVKAPGLASCLSRWRSKVGREIEVSSLIDGRGYYNTEDLAEVKNQEIFILGRKADYIKVSGEGGHLSAFQEIWKTSLADDLELHQKSYLGVVSEARLQAKIILMIEEGIEVNDSLLGAIEKYSSQVLPPFRIREVRSVAKIRRSSLGKVLWQESLAASKSIQFVF